LLCQRFYLGKIHHHAVGRVTRLMNDLASQRNFERISVSMQVATLALVIGNSMTSIKLESTGDTH